MSRNQIINIIGLAIVIFALIATIIKREMNFIVGILLWIASIIHFVKDIKNDNKIHKPLTHKQVKDMMCHRIPNGGLKIKSKTVRGFYPLTRRA